MDHRVQQIPVHGFSVPRFLKQRSSRWLILVTICMAVFSDAILYGVVVPILPFSLLQRSRIPKEDLQFWSSVLLASFGAAQLLGSPFVGWFADRSSSRRTPLLSGLVLNAIATGIFGVARNVYVLALSRFLQGLSASVVWAVGFALLVDTVGKDEIGYWVGYVLTSVNFGILVAPLAGGMLYDNLGYLSIFIMMLGLITIDIALRLIIIERKRARKWIQSSKSANYGTQGPNIERQQAYNEAPNDDPNNNSDSTAEAQPLLSAAKLASHPPPILTLLRSPRIRAALYGKLVEAIIVIGFDSALPTFVMETFQWGATGAGLIFLTITIPSLSAPLLGFLSDQYGPRLISIIGFLVGAMATASLQFVKRNEIGHIMLLCVLLTIDGFAFVAMISPLAADLTSAVISIENARPGVFGKSGAYAQVYALFTCAIGGGVLLGPAWVSVAYGRIGWAGTVTGLGVLSATAVLGIMIYTGREEYTLEILEE